MKSTPVSSAKTHTKKSTASQAAPGPEAVRQMIATAAYYRALKRGFGVGCEQEDWLAAEREIGQALAS